MAQKVADTKRVALFGLVALMVASLLNGAAPAGADTPSTTTTTTPPKAALSVSPPTSSLDATPGSAMTQKIGLDNLSNDTRNVSVQVENFSPSGEEGQAQLSEGEGPYALSQWITSSPSTAAIPPNGHQDFTITINVPKNAPPGGHFGAIVFSPAAGGASGGASLSVVSQVTSLILLRVPGDAKEKASVAGVNICSQKKDSKGAKTTTCDKNSKFLQNGPVVLAARLQNEGNVQVEPQGTVTIYNMFGSKVKSIQISPKNLLPDSIRRLDSTWNATAPFGYYKAKFQLSYGTNPQQLNVDKSFLVLPLTKIGIGVLGLILLFLIFWLPRKRLKKAFKALAAAD